MHKYLWLSVILFIGISAIAQTSQTTYKLSKKILFVVSNAHFYGSSDIATSNHFSEIVLPYSEFIKAGYEIDFVSPEGGRVPVGYIYNTSGVIEEYLYDNVFMDKLENTLSPDEVDQDAYCAIFYVGGGAIMFEVPSDKRIQNIAMHIYEKNNGVVASICHGTAGIVHLKKANGEYLVSGKDINGFPDKFENKEKEYYKNFPFSIQNTIEKHGGQFKYSEEGWDGYFEVDGRVITGQDPSSGREMAKSIIAELERSQK